MEDHLLDNLQQEKNAPLAERAADLINQLIIDRNFKAEDKLPNEFELAEALNVGRGTIREAEKLLVARNVLEIRRGKGTFVARDAGHISDPLGLAYMPDKIAVAKDLADIRLQLEPWIAGLAAERATDTEIAELQLICDDVEGFIRRGEDHLPRDGELHMAIARCTHNGIMPRLIPIITYSVSLFGGVNRRSLIRETISTHRRIVQGIAEHDPETARAAMYEHVLLNQKSIYQAAALLEQGKEA